MRMNIEGVIGEVHSLPGCSQVAVSHGVFVPEYRRKKGIGSRANKTRLNKLGQLGYDYVMCTVCEDNLAQIRVMQKNGWVRLDTFTSSRTGHKLCVYGRAVP